MTKRKSTLDPAMRRRVRATAKTYLAAEVTRLGEAGRLPVPGEESPWIDHRLLWLRRGDRAAEEFAEKLTSWLPTRWIGPDSYPGAREIVEALVRGHIAARTVQQIYGSDRRSGTVAPIAEFLDLVEHAEQEWRVMRLLLDVDSRQVDAESIHGARLVPVRGFQQTVSPLMPEGVAVADAIHFAQGSREPRTFLVREEIGRDGWMVALDVRPHMIHASTALRLVTAGKIVEPLELYGQPRMVHVGSPNAVNNDPGHDFKYWRRVGVVEPEQLEGIEAIAARLCDLDSDSAKKIPPALTVALSRFNRSHRAAPWADSVIDIAIGLEAALSTGERDELTLRIKSRATSLLARPGDSPGSIFADVGELLRIRGKVAHGEPIPQKRWNDLFAARGLTQIMVEDRLAILFDRWRDLLRRAILARLLLENAGPWRIGSPPSVGVDEALIDPVQRRNWRGAIRRRAEELGIGSAIDKPPALRDYLHDPYSDNLDN